MKNFSLNRFLLLLCLPFCGFPVFAQQSFSAPLFDDAAKVFGLSRFCTEVKYNYAYYDQLTFDWDSVCYSFIPDLLATETVWDYYREMQRLCALLGDGHTFILGPELDREDVIRPAPFQTRFLDDRVFIDEVYSSAWIERGVVKGTEILRINGVSALEYGRNYIMPYVSASTPQSRISRTYETFEFTKDRSGNPLVLELRSPDGNLFSVDIERGKQRWDLSRTSPFTYRTTEENIGVLHISGFSDEEMNEQFEALYEEILQTTALVIDLRNNTGGNSGYADYILQHLTKDPIPLRTWYSPMYIAAFASWGIKQEKYCQEGGWLSPVDKPIYTQPVVLLVNGSTYSSPENFCADFRDIKRGTIIGTPSGGSTGNGVVVSVIPGLLDAWICSKEDRYADGSPFVGVGILPDIEVVENAQDYLEGRDLLLEKAVEYLLKD